MHDAAFDIAIGNLFGRFLSARYGNCIAYSITVHDRRANRIAGGFEQHDPPNSRIVFLW